MQKRYAPCSLVSALFTVACLLLAFVGPEEDAAITGQLAVVGAVLFAANLALSGSFSLEANVRVGSKADLRLMAGMGGKQTLT